jgi:hypothetical protein
MFLLPVARCGLEIDRAQEIRNPKLEIRTPARRDRLNPDDKIRKREFSRNMLSALFVLLRLCAFRGSILHKDTKRQRAWHGLQPQPKLLTLMSLYLAGWASDEDVLRELNRPDNTGVKKRAKDELWKKMRRGLIGPSPREALVADLRETCPHFLDQIQSNDSMAWHRLFHPTTQARGRTRLGRL